MFIRRALLIVALALPTVGCAAIAKWLPVAVAALGEAGQVLDAVESAADAFFDAHGDEAKRADYARAMSKARSALAAAHHAAKGADDAGRQDMANAFEEFKLAYQELLALLGPLGVVAPATDGVMSAPLNDGPLMVPAPSQLSL